MITNVFKAKNHLFFMDFKSVLETKTSGKFIAGFITLVVLMLIILAGPASAFNASLGSFSDDTPLKGKLISATFDVTMNTAERAAITSIILYQLLHVPQFNRMQDLPQLLDM